MAQTNPHSPQVILERAHKIDKKRLPFEGECSNVAMDSHEGEIVEYTCVSVKGLSPILERYKCEWLI
jgi:hypothetical protein